MIQDTFSANDQTEGALEAQKSRLSDPAKILSNLYLSSIGPAQDKALLQKLKITHILNLTGPNPQFH